MGQMTDAQARRGNAAVSLLSNPPSSASTLLWRLQRIPLAAEEAEEMGEHGLRNCHELQRLCLECNVVTVRLHR